MALIIQKYGGTSVGNVEKIKNVARRVRSARQDGNDVIVVVSAMGEETDRLLDLARDITDQPDEKEQDVLISTGEQVSSSLLAMALKSLGINARSLLGHQIKIQTDSAFGKARILKIDSKRLLRELNDGKVLVIAGFQGVDEKDNITTLGRGGSDTSAVAIAAALKADICEIYTDVEGVFTADPNICPDARKLNKISYEEMLEMASLGAKVLQTRSVQFAKKYQVPIHVRSTFKNGTGTIVTKEDQDMESVIVSGVTYDKDEAKITVTKVPDMPGIASKLFTPISEANIFVDMIIQNVSTDGLTDLTFTVPQADFKKAMELVMVTAREINARDVLADTNIAKVSIVGMGMRSHSGVASKVFTVLAREGISIMMISTSEIKISCVIESKYTELAVRVLHEAFDLGENKEL
ncbi:MAG: aspartate kinase [Deltaproteobacteria bacterium CG12_big_fil_rev_8_21_14_0_65_43_10]|nr:MAG: aspartate kinase [Deltaproteobacteria bacterium CG2_30_43_15]PIQ45758.1 MAG: aspartate kinase [Deltaproteobacteria bacterium CG12_big_fil_rev_8_21_14_0_65_43_10]PIX22904.1 MAG: aspartate kinase [Deltaproteobacteria bacterium CG_4_8_14_3_um_filter_43_13]PIZ19010.1 MAG: aspartate kinase [Deltaproteobacteria bacterium CG_4_10_14_0_8_um_filter_43_12]PJB44435.1 MAG: aspartate kinase [Deltaproteobacteria bacterium CG_4_9_14_3_um_filter_44_9]HCX89639.1 aspartate kinase [Deltaproteobacteria ba